MDRFEVPCDRWERRLEALEHQQDVLDARHARLEQRLAQAVANGQDRRADRLEHQLNQVDRARARLDEVVQTLTDALATHCGTGGGT